MLGIIDRRKRTVVEQTVSVSGTRELNRHSVLVTNKLNIKSVNLT